MEWAAQKDREQYGTEGNWNQFYPHGQKSPGSTCLPVIFQIYSRMTTHVQLFSVPQTLSRIEEHGCCFYFRWAWLNAQAGVVDQPLQLNLWAESPAPASRRTRRHKAAHFLFLVERSQTPSNFHQFLLTVLTILLILQGFHRTKLMGLKMICNNLE